MWIRLAILLLISASAGAEIIPTYRRTIWTNAGVDGGIPNSDLMTVYTNCGTGMTLAQLNAVLASCPSNQVVLLTNGNFTFAGMVDFGQSRGVVLKGAGVSNTFITFSAHGGGVNLHIGEETIDRTNPPTANIKNWTAGFTQGCTTITLSNVTGLPAVGHLLALDQLNDAIVEDDGPDGGDYISRLFGERCQCQYVTITSSNGYDIGIWPPIHMQNIKLSLVPQAWWWDADDTLMSGLEDLTITNADGSGNFAIYLSQAKNCWVKDVDIHRTALAAIESSQCARVEVRNVRMLSNQSSESQSYGVVWYMTSDSMMIDCVAANITGSMNYGPQAQGNVVAYNYFTNNVYNPSNWDIACLASHDGHSCMNLTEGNWGNKMFYDWNHGSASHNTDFRNRYHGYQVGRTGNTISYDAEHYVRSNNVVGNILGTGGYHTNYWCTNATQYDNWGQWSIYVLGNYNAGGTPPWDNEIPSSTYLHGNYNFATSNILWDAGNEDHTLPASLFLATKPSWWGGCPWPPYDPTNTSEAAISPTNIPAGYRFIFGTDWPAGGGGDPASAGALRVKGARVGTLRTL